MKKIIMILITSCASADIMPSITSSASADIMSSITSCASVDIMPSTPFIAAKKTSSMTLVDAARHGDVSLVRRLLARGAPVNGARASTHGDVVTPLYAAATYGNEAVVGELLRAPGIEVNKEIMQGITALWSAAFCGNLSVVRAFLAADGIDVNAADIDGITPLFMAAYMGNLPVVRELLAAPGIDVNKASLNDGATPLCVAIAKGYFEVADELVKKDPTVWQSLCQCNDTVKDNMVIQSAVQGSPKFIQSLVQQCGLYVNWISNEFNDSLLHLAIFNRNDFAGPLAHQEVVKYLLSLEDSDGNYVVDVNEVHFATGATPLICAAMIGDGIMVDALLDANANLNVQDKFGRSALMHAVDGSGLEVVEKLLARHARTDLENNKGQTVFDLIKHYSQDPKDQQIAALLRDHHETKIVQEVAVSGASVVLTGTATAGTAVAGIAAAAKSF